MHPGSTIATLDEVLNLIDCYGAKNTTLNLETKLDPTAANETLPLDTYVNSPKFIPVLKQRGFLNRTIIQSFDWRTLVELKKKWGTDIVSLSALVKPATVVAVNGTYPWLGGVNVSLNLLLAEFAQACLGISFRPTTAPGCRPLAASEPQLSRRCLDTEEV